MLCVDVCGVLCWCVLVCVGACIWMYVVGVWCVVVCVIMCRVVVLCVDA